MSYEIYVVAMATCDIIMFARKDACSDIFEFLSLSSPSGMPGATLPSIHHPNMGLHVHPVNDRPELQQQTLSRHSTWVILRYAPRLVIRHSSVQASAASERMLCKPFCARDEH